MSRYRQIILHAGLSKTGTSSIQSNCELYSDFLLKNGIKYPQFQFREHSFNTHSIPLTTWVTGRPGKYGLRLKQRFPDSFSEVIASCSQQMNKILASGDNETLLLSSELIAGFEGEDIAVLRKSLELHTDSLRVIAYVRSPMSALASILQERLKMGGLPSPQAQVGKVRRRYENLQENFHDVLDVYNFHDASGQPLGLVGDFFSKIGVSQGNLTQLNFVTRNESLSMEAFKLMWAINEQYPPGDHGLHGVERRPHDLDLLNKLPGPPFHLCQTGTAEWREPALEETAWLEKHLGFRFPDIAARETDLLWQDPTLQLLAPTLKMIREPNIRVFAAQFLENEAQRYLSSRPDTASKLIDASQSLLTVVS